MNISQRYAETEVSGMSQIELETRALIKAAASLNQIKENWEQKSGDLDEALEKNRRLWTIIAGAMGDNSSPQPLELRQNLLSLSMFVFAGERKQEVFDTLTVTFFVVLIAVSIPVPISITVSIPVPVSITMSTSSSAV